MKLIKCKGNVMNKICSSIFSLTLLVTSGLAFSKEIPMGAIELSGNLDLSISSLESKPDGGSKVEVDTQTISASALYYIIDNLGVGLAWEYESSEASSNGSKDESTVSVIGPGIMYNISLNDKLSIKILAAIAKASTEFSSGGSTENVDGWAWTGGVGIAYFLTDSVSLDIGISYLSISQEVDSTSKNVDTSGFNSGLGISIYIN